jgi:hypothetical protein
MKFEKLSCFVAGFGIGVFSAFITWKWDTMPLVYAIAFVVLLAFGLYLSWILTFGNTKQSNDEKNPTSKSPKPITLKGSIKPTKPSDSS